MLANKIKKDITALPGEDLEEVEDFIKTLKIKKDIKKTQGKKSHNIFNVILDSAMDMGIKDLARNHDHYLYGTEKR
ncbi:MAG: hypothetical protein HY754_08680 [Nitrospirae bacterium]|nr:hypothetical protein [Nitrospirota bacterium]